MSIEKMEFVNLVGLVRYLDDALLKCVESGCFHLEQSNQITSESASGFVNLQEQNPYKEPLRRLLSLDTGSYVFHEADTAEIAAMTLEEMCAYVDKAKEKLDAFSAQIANYTEYIHARSQALKQLEHLRGMQVDLSSLFQCSHIAVRFGKLPNDSYSKLEYYDDRTFLFMPYDDDGEYRWGFYVMPTENVEEVDKIMQSLYFERIWVPDFVTGTPEHAAADLHAELESAQTELYETTAARDKYFKSHGAKLNAVFCRLKFQHDNFKLRSYASIYKDKFYLVGFVPARESKRFKALFADIPDVALVFKPPQSESGLVTPVKLRNGKFSTPFSLFVEMYGLPKYNGFNPTLLVAITYTLLFGIMFGDLGQGLLISLAGLIITKKTQNALGPILTRIGLSSAFFGFIFGSVFGFEEALDPIYKKLGLAHKPLEVMENTNFVIACAIGIGVALILVSIIINIILNFKNKDYTNALFSNNGLAGFIFFASLLAGLVCTMFLDIKLFTVPYIICLLILPVIIMFFREPLGCMITGKKYHSAGIGDFIATNFFEVFEFMLSYASNTLSFVRIGGFVFSHAGMMAVVMLLSESFSNASILVIILGNLFVIGMEGLIVGIQVLRLEFYEIFSRFYDGDGKAFNPVHITYEPVLD